MKRILLTSDGLTENLKQLFWENINKKPSDTRIIFVPSAATENDSAREGISMCIYKFMEMGIQIQNICTYNLKYLLSKDYNRTYSREVCNLPQEFRLMTVDELKEFDAIIFGGGDARLLIEEMNRTGLDNILQEAIEEGLLYIGISAGSMVAAGNFDKGLKYIKNPVIVHCERGTKCGEINQNDEIYLTNEQAIWIKDNIACIIN